MDESKKNRIILVIVIILLLLFIIIGGIIVHVNKNDRTSKIHLKQLYVSDHEIIPFDKLFLGISDDRLVSVVDEDGTELYLDDVGIKYDGIYMQDDDTPIIYNVSNGKLNVYVIGDNGPNKLFTINDVSEAVPLIYKGEKEYLMGFVQYRDNDTYLYNFENNGLVVLDGSILLGDKVYNNSIYTYSKEFIIAKKDDKYGAVNINGNLVIDYNYDDLMNDGISIIFAVKNKYGVMNSNQEIVLKPKYNIVKKVTDGYLIGNDRLVFYDNLLNKISNYKMLHNIDKYSLREDNSLYEYSVGDNYVIVNNYFESSLKKEYKYHNMYVIRNKKVSSIKQTGFNSENVIYSINKGFITIYSSALEKEMDIAFKGDKIDSIIKVQNDCYYIQTDKENMIYNKHGKKINNTWGRLVYHNDRYLVYINKKDIIFRDYSNRVLERLSGNDIIVSNGRLIVDGNIYLIEG